MLHRGYRRVEWDMQNFWCPSNSCAQYLANGITKMPWDLCEQVPQGTGAPAVALTRVGVCRHLRETPDNFLPLWNAGHDSSTPTAQRKGRAFTHNCTRQSIFPSHLPPTLTNEARPISSSIINTIFKPWMFHVSLKKKTNIQIPCTQQLWQLQPYLATSLEETNNYKSCIASKKLSAWNKSWKESKWHAPLIPVILPVVLNICKLRNC